MTTARESCVLPPRVCYPSARTDVAAISTFPVPRRSAARADDRRVGGLASLDSRTATARCAVAVLRVFVELRGLEPLTLCMPCRCATSCATAPSSPLGNWGILAKRHTPDEI